MKRAARLGGLCLCVAGLVLWLALRSSDGEDPALPLGPGPHGSTPAISPAAMVDGAQAESGRTEVSPELSAEEAPLVVPGELAHPFLYVLAVRVLDDQGLPVEQPPLRLAPVRSALNQVQALAEIGGWTTIVWRGKQPEMDVDLQVGTGLDLEHSRRLRVRAGSPNEVALLGDRELKGMILSPINLVYKLDSGDPEAVAVLVDSKPVPPLVMERFPHPHGRFGDLFLQWPPQPAPPSPDQAPAQVHLQDVAFRVSALEAVLRARVEVRYSFPSQSGEIADQGSSDPASAVLGVSVLDEAGLPAPGVWVILGQELDAATRSAVTDAEGRAVFHFVPSGWWEVRAGGGPAGLARARLFVEAPNALEWTATLDRGLRLTGRVLAASGEPARNVLVQYESIPDVLVRPTRVHVSLETRGGEEISESGDRPAATAGEIVGPWVDQVVPRDDGSFELSNLPPGLGRLIVVPADGGTGSLLVEEGVIAGGGELVLQLPQTPGGLHLGGVHTSSGFRGTDVVRAISLTTGRGVGFHHDGASGWISPGLAAGAYRVELGALARGWHDLGVHLVSAGTITEVGNVDLPDPARLALKGPQPVRAKLYLRRDDLDLRAESAVLSGGDTVDLPPGDYWVFWTPAEGDPRYGAVRVESGVTTEFSLD